LCGRRFRLPSSGYHEVLLGIFIAIIVLILYGSLYPWHFQAVTLPASPIYLLLHSWHLTGGRRFIADVAVNVAIYVPLGMSAFLTFRKARYIAPVAIGAALSAFVEMTQLYIPGRVCSSFDLLDNIIGSAIGVLLGLIFQETVDPFRFRDNGTPDPSAVALLYCWLASLLFPFLPETSLRIWFHKTALSLHGAGAVGLLSIAATWYAAYWLLRGAGFRREWWLVSIILIPAQIFIASRQPYLPSMLLVFAVAPLIAMVFHKNLQRPGAFAFLAIIIIRGLAPFHFDPQSQPFLWTPFAGYLGMDWQPGIRIFLEKLFYYGASIWLLRDSGVKWLPATGVVGAVLAIIELIQTHIPGRTPEITDPLLALLLGLGLMSLTRKQPIGYHANS
jgi:VanZ family protein